MIASFFAEMGAFASGHVSLLMMLLKATIILLVALGITLAMQRSSASARYLVWVVTLGMLVLIPALATWAPLPLRILPAANVVSIVTGEPSWSSVPWTAPTNDLRSANGARPAPQESLSLTSGSKLMSTLREMSGVSLILIFWAAVATGILATLTWAGFTVRRIVRRARPLESQDWVTPLFEIADRLGLEQPPRLLQSDEAKMPFACGVLKPTIVLPAESENWNLDRRRAVLLHGPTSALGLPVALRGACLVVRSRTLLLFAGRGVRTVVGSLLVAARRHSARQAGPDRAATPPV